MAGPIDELEDKIGMRFEELPAEERKAFLDAIADINKTTLDVNKLRTYILQAKAAVENELCKPNMDPEQDIFLKARLRNYMLLEGFMSTPEEAQRKYDQYVANVIASKAQKINNS